ncbi:MAG: hypothetical protein OES24_12160 [Acidimicrobiia bacterium]|nr:hypothetical protein [Acidimicrobiia bacterium]
MRTDGTATVDHYLKPILEHKNLIVAITAVTGLLAVAASLVLPPSYRSTASVLLTPISGNPLTPLESDTDVDMATELLISTSKAVVGRVADDLNGQSIGVDGDKLADNVSASSPRDSKVLELTYRAAAPELAQTVANSFAANYLEYREQIAFESRAAAVELLNERIALLKDQLSQIEGRWSQLESGSQPYVALSVERDSVGGELQAQQEALAALSTLSLSAGEVLSPAQLPVAPTGPGPITLLAGGLAGGLVIGVMAAMLLSAVQASRAPRNRRASDNIEQNRRQEDRFQIGGRRASDRQSESAVAKLARVTASRELEPVEEREPMAWQESIAEHPPAAWEKPVVEQSAIEPHEPIQAEEPVAAHDPTEPHQPIQAEEPVAAPSAPTPTGHSIVHSDTPPEPPSSRRTDPAADSDAGPAVDDDHDTAPEPEPDSPLPPIAEDIAEDIAEEIAAHFGADVPPPPRNKAKLKHVTKSPEEVEPHDRHANGTAGNPQVGIAESNLEVETDFGRLVEEIRRQLTVGPLACLAIGQNNRAQSVAAGFTLVDSLKDLEVDVLIIDAMLDAPVLADVMELPNVPGLSELVVGQAPMEAAIQELEGFSGLYVVTTGDPTSFARSAFGTPKLRDLLRGFKQRFPVTVIVGGDVADAAVMARTGGELDGLVVATSAAPGHPGDAVLAEQLSALDAPVWVRIFVAGEPEPTSTAAAATTTV